MAMMSARPRVLHILSDWKWTGPAEPIVNLCRQLRRGGFAVDFACRRALSNYPQSLEHRARERRVDPVLDFQLKKKPNLFANLSDIRAMREYMDREEVQIVHVHSSHDHLLASRAAKGAHNPPYVVRSNHTGEPVPNSFWHRLLIKGHTHGWAALSQPCLDADLANFDIDPRHGVVVEGTVDMERFNTERKFTDVRSELGIADDEILLGIVARVQKHRRFDIFLPALAEAMAAEPKLKALIIGRGTNFDRLARQPVNDLGIADRVIMPGYRSDDFADYLNAIDFKLFLVPGSDGSCRAVREAMAIGKPILAARRGLLPELVEDGKCGIVFDDTHEGLVKNILKLSRDADLRRRLGQAGATKARESFSLARQVQTIGDLYMKLAEGL
jgi:L-malate glycosyltransferase